MVECFDCEKWTILCEPLQSHGKWDGKEPFGKASNRDYQGPVAVLTRATIRIKQTKNFWANVGQVSELMKESPGLYYVPGYWRAPVYKQATFSVWNSLDDVKAFAYGSKNMLK